MDEITCDTLAPKLTAFQTGLTPESEGLLVREHLESCADCTIFNGQVEAARMLLSDFSPSDEVDVEDLLAEGEGIDFGETDPKSLLRQLTRIATAIAPDRAEDLVQQTFLAAAAVGPAALQFGDLAQELTDLALEDDAPEFRSIEAFGAAIGATGVDHDGDADPESLYYPEFYTDGPNVGQYVTSPVIWGETNTLTPEEDFDTNALYAAVEQALEQMEPPLGALVALVDVEGVPLAEAAGVLRLQPEHAAASLNRARIHVRGAIDGAFA